ncbi:MAG: hypothetical protein KTR28_03235 [Micavibrio sp.]|nr:hypothetical protein [Micavibrio sp.]
MSVNLSAEREEFLKNFNTIEQRAVEEKQHKIIGSQIFMRLHEVLEEARTKGNMFSKDVFTGLDTAKFSESERNLILLHLETIGKKVGLHRRIILTANRKGRIAMKGDLDHDHFDDDENERFWFALLLRVLDYDQLYYDTLRLINRVQEQIKERLDLLEDEIERREPGTIEEIFCDVSDKERDVDILRDEEKYLKNQQQKLQQQEEQLLSEKELPEENDIIDIKADANKVKTKMDFFKARRNELKNPPPKKPPPKNSEDKFSPPNLNFGKKYDDDEGKDDDPIPPPLPPGGE